MGYCRICGDDVHTAAVRYWDPDDGWTIGRLCSGCKRSMLAKRPSIDDYAIYVYAAKHSMSEQDTLQHLTLDTTPMDIDAAIDAIYG